MLWSWDVIGQMKVGKARIMRSGNKVMKVVLFSNIIGAHNFKAAELKSTQADKQNSTMKFSTITSVLLAFVMTFASTFGSAADAAPVRNLRGLDVVPTEENPTTTSGADLRQLEIQAMEDYQRDLEEFNAGHGDRELSPDISCYKMWCLGKVRGTCYIVYPKCYPL
jgi:hypothetical protein